MTLKVSPTTASDTRGLMAPFVRCLTRLRAHCARDNGAKAFDQIRGRGSCRRTLHGRESATRRGEARSGDTGSNQEEYMMRVGKRVSWMAASVLAVALAGCCDSNTPLGVRESGGGGPAVVLFGTTSTFGVLGNTVTNTGGTAVTGDVGASPGATVSGFPPGTATGTIYLGGAIAAQAQTDLTAAYNDAAGRTTGAITVSGDLTGLTLTPGLYKSTSSLGVTGALTLNALGNANAVFIIQMASTLTTGSGSQIILTGGAQAKNIIWQVGSSATLGTNSVFKGTIMALTSITMNTGAHLDGRALASGGAVTLDTNVIVAQ
jgi:ice-binding like protein